jgi:hypothetical protein
MFVVKNKLPFGREHFGGVVGIVDWGRDGENVIAVPDSSSVAVSMRVHPAYREVFLPAGYGLIPVVVPTPPVPAMTEKVANLEGEAAYVPIHKRRGKAPTRE